MKNKQHHKANKPLVIAGPCAAESEEQILEAIQEAKKRHVDFIRISLWKPRTKPGFDGLGRRGLKLLVAAAKAGVNPATEVILPEHAKMAMKAVFAAVPRARLMLWIGSRNQNHIIQRKIATAVAGDRRVTLMVKNQPWTSEDHWEGIVSHVLGGGVSHDRVMLCHRGFVPNGINPHGYKNVPDYAMAMRIKEKTGLPMLFDPSHTGGAVVKVLQVAREAKAHHFDGVIVEVHRDPIHALTDAKQQLTWKEFDQLTI
jgi:3-deoxy-D-arabino-heptulosonate 7-phosphate (DAHP) synthase